MFSLKWETKWFLDTSMPVWWWMCYIKCNFKCSYFKCFIYWQFCSYIFFFFKNHRFHHAHQSFFSLEEGNTVSFAQNRSTSLQACIPLQCMCIYKCACVLLIKEKQKKSFQKTWHDLSTFILRDVKDSWGLSLHKMGN